VSSGDVTGWTVTRSEINYMDGYFQTFGGTRCLDLNHVTGGGVSQAVATTPGKRYVVSFDLAGNPLAGASPELKRVRVEAAGHFAEFEFDVTGRTPEDMGWTLVSWDFVASSPSTLLEIFSLTGGGEGPTIDNVVVDFPVPGDSSTWGRIKALYF
jgi:choice-of-anchor C domain-containing protein